MLSDIERDLFSRVALLVYPHSDHGNGCWPCPLLLYGLFRDDEENSDLMLGAVVGLS